MGKTPNRFPGRLEAEDGFKIYSGSSSPTEDGEVYYLSGSGFIFRENGQSKQLGSGDHNLLSGIQGGVSGQFYHVTSDQYGAISSFDWADKQASYILVGTTASLPNERHLTVGSGLKLSDLGVHSSIDVSIDDSILATLSGATFSGNIKALAGLSGSLQRLSNGESYLLGGRYVTITSSSSGQISIATSADPVIWETVSGALGGQAGSNDGWVFKSDGSGGGTMGPNIQRVPNRLTVGTGFDVDYTSIKEAVDVAIINGASAANPWEITVMPGVYVEDPITVIVGITLSAEVSTGASSVYVVAKDPLADLFVCTGGFISGFTVSGVSHVDKCLFRIATPNTLCALQGIFLSNCSNGVIVSNGASALIILSAINVDNVGQAVNTGVTVTGTGSYCAISNFFASVPTAILPYYASNPVQTVISAHDGAELYVNGAAVKVASFDGLADGVYADGGSTVTCISSEFSNCGNAFHVGPAGSNTTMTAISVINTNNTLNFKNDSSTGALFKMSSSDIRKTTSTTGGVEVGLVQYRNERFMRLFGELYYRFPTEKDLSVTDFFYDLSSTGICENGEVTVVSGLNVAVAAGEGFVRRSLPYEDAYGVTWSSGSLTLFSSSINYVFYDSTQSALTSSISAPGETGILLRTISTHVSGVLYSHDTRTWVYDIQRKLHDYLYDVQKTKLKSGLAVIQGTTSRKINVSSGEYYLSYSPIVCSGSGGDATFNYIFGTAGSNVLNSQTLLDNSRYDSSGSLTTMTSGFFRSDTVIITSDNTISVIYGTQQCVSQSLALDLGPATLPDYLNPSGFVLARAIVLSGSGISTIVDERTTRTTGGSGGGVTVHAALAGLDADDHTQYLLTNGGRSMTGDLNLAGHDIVSAGTVNGIDVASHNSRHQVGGADALSVGIPVAIIVGATPATGSASDFSVSDHQHGIQAGTPVQISTSNAEGNAATVARSNHQHDHGSQTDPSQHAIATTGSNGFMSVSHVNDLNDSLRIADHKSVRDLIHFIDDGPADVPGIAGFKEILPFNSLFPTSKIWWTNSGKTHKIVEKIIQRLENQRPEVITWKMYEGDGTTVAMTVSDTLNYSASIWTPTRTRNIT